jgi:hypothetical protein
VPGRRQTSSRTDTALSGVCRRRPPLPNSLAFARGRPHRNGRPPCRVRERHPLVRSLPPVSRCSPPCPGVNDRRRPLRPRHMSKRKLGFSCCMSASGRQWQAVPSCFRPQAPATVSLRPVPGVKVISVTRSQLDFSREGIFTAPGGWAAAMSRMGPLTGRGVKPKVLQTIRARAQASGTECAGRHDCCTSFPFAQHSFEGSVARRCDIVVLVHWI